MKELTYLAGYPEQVCLQIRQLLHEGRLGEVLLKRHPAAHEIKTDRALYDYTLDIKNQFLRKAAPLSKVVFDTRINLTHQALGLHSFVSRVQGGKLKAKSEIRIGAVFKIAPLAFLRMIVVHELAHLKEKEHNKAFYNLCFHMEPAYPQLEFDVRLYLTHLELCGPLY
ncbi:YgjP-like metallopeptidase domain-containing protein [Geopsychrobacter electrodiphilus]|uniref:YgjP-like metallopeptidase domain-containing protein n=1 Tax=Geopsychrobacter electrodiphilus TaxID=225196 RepID=UPI00037C6319|nr:M48 family metallopeptidase [Geopsychrobacter electrodiphilus]